MKNRIRLLLITMSAIIFAAGFLGVSIPGLSLLDVSNAQNRDSFRHSTAAHKKDCNSCHTMPTSNWVRARGFPDVAEFPGHASCIGCHRRDFFMGNRPTICAGCHVNPGPRGAARFPFPVTSRSSEFSTIFPHDVHQDIIAKVTGPKDVAVGHFIFASFTPAAAFVDDDKKPQFNNCAICHKTTEKLPKTAPRIDKNITPLADAAPDNFVAKAEFFKDSPSGHASCFQCHFQGLKPSAINCASCHKLEAPYFDKNILQRYSLKFDHASTNHANKDCTTCHVRITQNADLKTMKDADVPILACSTSSCHGSNITTEIGKRETSITEKQPAFQCNYCHTTAVGRFPIPQSHKDQ